MRRQPAKKISKTLCGLAQNQKLKMGKGAIVSCVSKYIHPSLWVRNHHVNIGKGHQLERITVLQRREYKKIRGKEGIMGHCGCSSQDCG